MYIHPINFFLIGLRVMMMRRRSAIISIEYFQRDNPAARHGGLCVKETEDTVVAIVVKDVYLLSYYNFIEGCNSRK